MAVQESQHKSSEDSFAGDYVDDNLYLSWKVKARHLLSAACGENSVHFKEFVKREAGLTYATNYETSLVVKAVFDAARDDFDGGYLTSVRNIIQAEVFSTELDQAHELLSGGYITAAAVIAGVVLETTMRRLCDDEGISHGALNKMNADLLKAGRYSMLVHKRITALADIRNNAAHGHTDKFNKDDVADMIDKVEGFVADQL
jgi:hypothetical protein